MKLSFVVICTLLATQAHAHVVFNQANVTPASLVSLELRVTHGCGGSPTKEVRVKIPEGVSRVTPRALAGWEVSVSKRRLASPIVSHGTTITEVVDTIIWSGGSFPDFAYQQFELRAMTPNAPLSTLYFPVEQICETGKLSWTQTPATLAGWAALQSPAPYVTLSRSTSATPGAVHKH